MPNDTPNGAPNPEVTVAPATGISPAPPPSLWDRVKAAITEGIPSLSTRTVNDPKYNQMQLVTPEAAMTPAEQKAHPIATGLSELAGGLTSPEMVGVGAATGGLGELPGAAKAIIPKLVSAGFSVDAFKNAYNTVPALKTAMDKGDSSEALRLFTHMVGDLGMSFAAGSHALEGVDVANTKAALVRPLVPGEAGVLRVGKVTPKGKYADLGGEHLEALPEPAPMNPQEIADLQAQHPGRVITPESAAEIRKAEAARADIESRPTPQEGAGRGRMTEEEFKKKNEEFAAEEAATGGPQTEVATIAKTEEPKPIAQRVEDAGMVYKKPLVKGEDSSPHMVEHPNHPGKTTTVKPNDTPEVIKQKVEDTLRDRFKVDPDVPESEPEFFKRQQAERDAKANPVSILPEGEPHWSEKVASRMKDEPVGGINPRTGESDTKGFGVEVYPEAKQRFDHQPTAEDIQTFADKNKDILDKHPELRVGWDKDPSKGWELNIGAAGEKPAGASLVAKKLDQRAAFDIEKGEEIPTGGQNVKTKFSRYPLEQRLADLTGKNVEKLPPGIRDSVHLTDEEKTLLGSDPTAVKDFMAIRKKLPPSEELAATMQAGQANRFWYERAAKTFTAMFDSFPKNTFPEADREIFPKIVAATSPQQSPDLNIRGAIDAYKAWIDEGRPTDPKDLTPIFKPMMLGAHSPNVARAIRGEPLSGPKVSSFMKNLSENPKYAEHVTNDMWGAITNGIVEPKDLTKDGTYIALSENYRKAAQSLGWSPKQGQAASWGFVRTLGYASGWKGTGKWRPPGEIAKMIDDPLVRKYSADIAEIALTDSEVRDRLVSLGIDLETFDENLRKGVADLGRGGEGKAEGVAPKLIAKTAQKVDKAKQYARSQVESGKRVSGKMQEMIGEAKTKGTAPLAGPKGIGAMQILEAFKKKKKA